MDDLYRTKDKLVQEAQREGLLVKLIPGPTYRWVFWEGVPVGLYSAHFSNTVGYWMLSGIFITEKFRGRGIMAQEIKLGLCQIPRPIYSAIAPWNESSQVLHRKIGFQYVGTWNDRSQMWRLD